jgi:hypothetical protein
VLVRLEGEEWEIRIAIEAMKSIALADGAKSRQVTP